jgi:hypothetical protein
MMSQLREKGADASALVPAQVTGLTAKLVVLSYQIPPQGPFQWTIWRIAAMTGSGR